MLSRRRQYIRLLLMLLFAKAKIWDSFRFYLFFADASFKYISSKCCKKTGCVCSFFFNTFIMPRSLDTQKLLFNIKHVAS